MGGREPTPFPGILHLVRQDRPPKDGSGGNASRRGNAAEKDEGGDRLDTGWVASVREGGTKWLVHPTIARKTTTESNRTKKEPGTTRSSSKDGRPASGADLAIEKKGRTGLPSRTENGRQEKVPPRGRDENGTKWLVHPSLQQPRGGDDAVAWSQMVDLERHLEQPGNDASFAWGDFQCGPDANALPDVESVFSGKSDQKSRQLDKSEPSRDGDSTRDSSLVSRRVTPLDSGDGAEAKSNLRNPDERSQSDSGHKQKVDESSLGVQSTRKSEAGASPPDWRKSIPEECVDPISLEPLCELDYPPFAIVADGPPYTPVFPGEWPPVESADETSGEEERELAILRAQWGEQAVPKVKSEDSGDNRPLAGRRFNLFDGRTLAFYLVSTLQFIDPYNRRDLSRDELRALDAYLSHHGLKRAGVVEAFDQKGISISTAGARAQTALGRAELLQQNAALIMSFIHSGRSVRAKEISRLAALGEKQRTTRGKDEAASVINSLQHMYAQNESRAETGGDSGLLIVDDDEAPALRGLSHNEALKRTTREQEQHFPSLPSERTSMGAGGRLPAASAPPDFRAVAKRGQRGQKPASFVAAEAKKKRELQRQEKEKKELAYTKLTFL